jgi:hypothetical protein
MTSPTTKRAWILAAALIALAASGVCAYLYFYGLHRPLLGASAGPAPKILSLLPPAAPVVGYADVAALRKLQGTELAAMLGLAGADPQEDADYQNFVKATGFDYERDLDTVAVAIWPTSLLAPKGGLGDNKALAVADGRFDQEKIKAYALRSGKVVARGTRSIYTVPGDPPVSFTFLSATRIALVSGPGTEDLLVNLKSSAADPAMQTRINRVAGAPIFAVARTDTLPNSFYDSFKEAPQLESLARTVEGLSLAGQPKGDGIDLALDGECDSLTHAAEIATLLDTFRMLGPVALSDPKTLGQMTKEQAAFLGSLASQVKVTHQDHWVRLTLSVTPEMLGGGNSTRAELR